MKFYLVHTGNPSLMNPYNQIQKRSLITNTSSKYAELTGLLDGAITLSPVFRITSKG